MITITCTNCQTSLTMDEAFAGGVCRCQHCGTIQTVPKTAKHGASAGSVAGSKTLWKQKTASDTSAGTGLDELADIVASSGLAGSGLQSGGLRKRPTTATAPPPAANKKMVPILAGAGGAIAVVLILGIWFLIKGDNPAGEKIENGPGLVNTGQSVAVAGPSFGPVKLKAANTVAYVIDRGGGSSNVFGDLRTLTIKSISSLGSDRKFQIVFWEIKNEVYAYPESGATTAGESSINEATRKINDDVYAFGYSRVGPALKKAAASNPDAIIIATGKGGDLTEEFTKDVRDNRPKGVKIHTLNLGSGEAPLLKAIAAETGGEYHVISEADLRNLK
jgi:hypothetical protein